MHRVKDLPGDIGIGHVRYSTVTMDRAENIQPFTAGTPYGQFAIAHNGNLKNQDALARELESYGALLSTSLDTELIVHLVARLESAHIRGRPARGGEQNRGRLLAHHDLRWSALRIA